MVHQLQMLPGIIQCSFTCIFNTVAAWFIDKRIDMDINSDEFLIRRTSNRNEACKTFAADTIILNFV